MDLFLDDPNNDVDSDERNFSKNAHLLAFIGSLVPPLNIILPFAYSKTKANLSPFEKQHVSNALNFQLMVLLLIIVGAAIYFVLSFFYVLLYAFFLILFQSFYTYQAYAAAKSGIINNYSFTFKIF